MIEEGITVCGGDWMKSFAIFIEDLYACIYIIIIIMSLVHV